MQKHSLLRENGKKRSSFPRVLKSERGMNSFLQICVLETIVGHLNS